MTTIVNALNNAAEWATTSSVVGVKLSNVTDFIQPLYYVLSGLRYLVTLAAA